MTTTFDGHLKDMAESATILGRALGEEAAAALRLYARMAQTIAELEARVAKLEKDTSAEFLKAMIEGISPDEFGATLSARIQQAMRGL